MNFWIDMEQSVAHYVILPIGDSITWGRDTNGGYREPLQVLLAEEDINYDFVGPVVDNSSGMADPEHAGYSGFRIDEIATQVALMPADLSPTAILLDVGTNDVLQSYNTGSLNDRLDSMIGYLRICWPSAHIYVATIGPLAGSWPALVTYNAHIMALAIPNVTPVDMAAGGTVDELFDGIHPTAARYLEMAQAWLAALVPA